MFNLIGGLDHPLIAVADLDAAKAAYERLGFTVTPRGGHPEWGTANHCIMFAQNYLELLAPVGEGERATRLRAFLNAQGEGLMSAAFATNNAQVAYDMLVRNNIIAAEPQSLSRNLETPEGMVAPRFGIVPLDGSATPGLPAFLVQHLTPELLRRPDWLAHPNTAQGIRSLSVAVEDPEAVMPVWTRLFGPASATPTDEVVTIHTDHGLIYLARPDDLEQLHPDADFDAATAPAVLAMAIEVADPEQAAALLKENTIPFSRDRDGSLRIDQDFTCGVYLELVRAA